MSVIGGFTAADSIAETGQMAGQVMGMGHAAKVLGFAQAHAAMDQAQGEAMKGAANGIKDAAKPQ